MPELPEVEHLRRSLSDAVLDTAVTDVDIRRSDIIRCGRTPVPGSPQLLLTGSRIARLDRHGKQLAMVGSTNRAVIVRLGMTGRLRVLDPSTRLPPHCHIIWTLIRPDGNKTRLAFIDPRRFGGIEPTTLTRLRASWEDLGPDALTIRAAQLQARLAATRRSVKAALLDQRMIAGLGNIYVDESLHRAGINPFELPSALAAPRITLLAQSIRAVLRAATAAGGSTIRDYRDAQGASGSYQQGHRVYGRAGLPCRSCGSTLVGDRIVGRMTVFCPCCQPLGVSGAQECVSSMNRRSISSSP